MEKIIEDNGVFYYGNSKCESADGAYRKFRTDYNRNTGRDSNSRLNNLGRRKDFVHWAGFCFDDKYRSLLEESVENKAVVKSRILGILCTSYCRILGKNDMPVIDESSIDTYIDWLLSEHNTFLKLTGRKNGLGRTNRRNRINFK